jgi:hypothetical protein
MEKLRQALLETKRVSDARDAEKNAKIAAIHNSHLMTERHEGELEEQKRKYMEELRQAQLEIERVSDDRDAEKNAKVEAIRSSNWMMEEQKRASDVTLAEYAEKYHRRHLNHARLCADIQHAFLMSVAQGNEHQENHGEDEEAFDDSVGSRTSTDNEDSTSGDEFEYSSNIENGRGDSSNNVEQEEEEEGEEKNEDKEMDDDAITPTDDDFL